MIKMIVIIFLIGELYIGKNCEYYIASVQACNSQSKAISIPFLYWL